MAAIKEEVDGVTPQKLAHIQEALKSSVDHLHKGLIDGFKRLEDGEFHEAAIKITESGSSSLRKLIELNIGSMVKDKFELVAKPCL